MSNDFSFDVFLSHNHADKPRVRRLAERLKAEGVRVWFDEWNVQPWDIIVLKVDEGLEKSRVLLLCLSPNALASGWVALERSTAIHRDPANEGRRFMPPMEDFYIGGASVKLFLPIFKWAARCRPKVSSTTSSS